MKTIQALKKKQQKWSLFPKKHAKVAVVNSPHYFAGHNHSHPTPTPHQPPLYAASSAPAYLGSGPKHNAVPKDDTKLSFQEHKLLEDSSSMDTMSMDSVSSLDSQQQGFALNLALLSPYLEKFAESSDTWLGNFVENLEGIVPYNFNYGSSASSSTMMKYEFLGNLISGDVMVDPFAPAASMTPESCSLEFCYKLLYQKLVSSENNKKLYSAIKDKWREILVALKSLEWTKAQDLLTEMDFNYSFSSQKLFSKSPALVMWSPGIYLFLKK